MVEINQLFVTQVNAIGYSLSCLNIILPILDIFAYNCQSIVGW